MDNVNQPSVLNVAEYSLHTNITKLMNISKEIILNSKAVLERNNSIPSGKSIDLFPRVYNTISTLELFQIRK